MAPQTSIGIGATDLAASAFWIRRLPTWGPLPCVSTTRQPSSTSSAIRPMAPSMLKSCSSKVPTWPGWRMALPPRATTTVLPFFLPVAAIVVLLSLGVARRDRGRSAAPVAGLPVEPPAYEERDDRATTGDQPERALGHALGREVEEQEEGERDAGFAEDRGDPGAGLAAGDRVRVRLVGVLVPEHQ